MHPGQPCGPCHLCQHSSTHYCHIATWDDRLKQKLTSITMVSDSQCICRACEGDFKRNADKDGYQFRWMAKGPDPTRCIITSCTTSDCIVHTGIARISDLLHEEVLSESHHLLIPICINHYRHLYRLLHESDHMYAAKVCFTCHSVIHGKPRHCPNPTAVQQYYSVNGDTDIDISEKDYICTNCYNHQLTIVQSTESTSTDQELKQLLTSQHSPALWAESYTQHITLALNQIITRLGDVLIKKLAVLFPDVFRCFMHLVILEANKAGITLTESNRDTYQSF